MKKKIKSTKDFEFKFVYADFEETHLFLWISYYNLYIHIHPLSTTHHVTHIQTLGIHIAPEHRIHKILAWFLRHSNLHLRIYTIYMNSIPRRFAKHNKLRRPTVCAFRVSQIAFRCLGATSLFILYAIRILLNI